MPLDLAPEAAGLSAAIAALTATIGQAVQHWAGGAKRDERRREAEGLRTEIAKLSERVGHLDLAGVRAESDRERLREALGRMEGDLTGLRVRMEQQGVTVEAELRPLREGIHAMRLLLQRAGGTP